MHQRLALIAIQKHDVAGFCLRTHAVAGASQSVDFAGNLPPFQRAAAVGNGTFFATPWTVASG